jgi:hypothetical protein
MALSLTYSKSKTYNTIRLTQEQPKLFLNHLEGLLAVDYSDILLVTKPSTDSNQLPYERLFSSPANSRERPFVV